MVREDGSILFDPTKCDDCYHMVGGWEAEFDYNKMMAPYMNNYKNPETCGFKLVDGKLCYEPNKRLMKDPTKERLYKRRTRNNWHFNESKFACKKVQREFKMYCKQMMIQENYHNPVPHEYHTYGYETW